MTATKLLIVEDDEVTLSKMTAYFEAESYEVYPATTGEQARKILNEKKIDLLLLDINLPDDDGLTIARETRSSSNIGIILVSGRAEDVDRIVGLEVGADDYVTKPFNSRELLARVKSVLRRSASPHAPGAMESGKTFSGWKLDNLRRTLTSPKGETVTMTRAEHELIDALTNQPGVTLSRERLMTSISHRAWNPNDRTVDVLIRRLRQKLENNPKKPELIKTMHGEGYMFCDQVSELVASSNAPNELDS